MIRQIVSPRPYPRPEQLRGWRDISTLLLTAGYDSPETEDRECAGWLTFYQEFEALRAQQARIKQDD